MDDRTHDIAVIGMHCRLPGASDPATYWRNLCAGVESTVSFSDEELLAAGVDPELLRDPSYVKAGGVLADAYAFDADFFGVSAREAQAIDPQQRVLLECAAAALDDAGYDPARYAGAIGVFAGSGFTSHMERVLAHPELVAAVGGLVTYLGNARELLTTRISYKLDLRGPSVAVQTACSTSLVAIHLAVQSLLNRECDLALAGGVTVGVDQVRGYRYQEGAIYSPDGHCRAFDARAAGTVGSSGAGLVVLRRLTDALSDGDCIHAVVKGSAINNDGAAKIGFTAPSVTGQAKVIAEALAVADVDPSTVSYIETHGTGTPLGDPIEIAALAEVFRPVGRKAVCALGAVKTNIGHTDCAAGVAGFIKTVLALEHRLIPPTLHFERPNPETGLEDSPFYVNAVLREWTSGTPRRAGVSSFGIGGTNAHVVLEEVPAPPPRAETDAPELLVLSAKNEAALTRLRANLADHLSQHPDLPLADVAYTLQEGRAIHAHRWACAARTLPELRDALTGESSRQPATRCAEDRTPPVAFLFPGQGAQYPGMARELYARESVFRRELDRCADVLAADAGLDLRMLLFSTDRDAGAADARLQQTRHAQPALFAVEYALAMQWMAWGVRPQAMLGHSIGEYVAACLAGVFSCASALRLLAIRGRLMQALPAGAMLAVPLSEADVRARLPQSLSLAAVNSARHCVVSGAIADIEAFDAQLTADRVSTRRLHTSHAFHSPAMDPILDAFAAEVTKSRLSTPTIPFLSNLTGDWITPEQATDPRYWARHVRETVRFADGVGVLLQDPQQVLLEIGPGDTLATLARRHPAHDVTRLVVRSLPRADQSEPGDVTLLDAAGALWTAGVALDWPSMRRGEPRRRVPLPTYPFARTEYRVPRATRTLHAAPRPQAMPKGVAMPRPAEGSLQAVPSSTRLPQIAERVAEMFASLFGTDAARLDRTRNFMEYGADSLLLMQASRMLESTFGIRVPFRHLLETLSSVERLSAHLDREMPAERERLALVAEAAPIAEVAPIARPEPISMPPPRVPETSTIPETSDMHDIVAQQLELMQTQLALLGETSRDARSIPDSTISRRRSA